MSLGGPAGHACVGVKLGAQLAGVQWVVLTGQGHVKASDLPLPWALPLMFLGLLSGFNGKGTLSPDLV